MLRRVFASSPGRLNACLSARLFPRAIRCNSTYLSVTAACQLDDGQRTVYIRPEGIEAWQTLSCAPVNHSRGVGSPCENQSEAGHTPEGLLAAALATSFDTTLRQAIHSAEPPEDARFNVYISALVDLQLETPTVDHSEEVSAQASHILVKTREAADSLLQQLQESGDSPGSFASLAQQHSSCPSGKTGGSLGEFTPGTMLAPFDAAVFAAATPLNTTLTQPVETEYGWHIIRVMERSDKPPPKYVQRARLRVDFDSDQPNGFVQALVSGAFEQDRMCQLFSLEKDRLFVSVATPSCIWRLDVGPAN